MTAQLKDIREAYYPEVRIPRYYPGSYVNTLLNGLPWYKHCKVLSFQYRQRPYEKGSMMAYEIKHPDGYVLQRWEDQLEASE